MRGDSVGIFDKLKKNDAGDPLTDPALDSSGPDPFSNPPDLSNPYGDPLASRDPFSIGQDPMGSSFAPDPTAQQSQPYPGAAPFPGQNRAPPEERHFEHERIQEEFSHRDAELILAKLDAIKSELDSLHQRVRGIEQNQSRAPPPQPKKYAW